MITIELPWPDKRLSPNARVHWREKADAASIAGIQGSGLTNKALDEQGTFHVMPDKIEARYTFFPPDKRHRDIDNALSSCKAMQDGVCFAIGIDDSRIKRTVLEWGEVVKGGKVVLRLEEMT